VSPALLERTGLAERLAAREPHVMRGGIRTRALAALLDSRTFHMQDLDTELDRGRYVECRHPLLDVRLVRLALALPGRITGTWDTDPRRLHDAAFGARLAPAVRVRRRGADFSPFVATEMREMRARHRGCPSLVARGWVLAARVAALDEQADSAAGMAAAGLAYSLNAWAHDQGGRRRT
jgi:hypothetical protein